jgi:hypothetical protein
MMSLGSEMVGGIHAALELEALIRSAEVMRRPLKLPEVRLEDWGAGLPDPRAVVPTAAREGAGASQRPRKEYPMGTDERKETPDGAAPATSSTLGANVFTAPGKPMVGERLMFGFPQS